MTRTEQDQRSTTVSRTFRWLEEFMDYVGTFKKLLLIALASLCVIADAVAGQQSSAKPILSQFAFIENKGQWDARVRFRLTSGSKTLWLTDTGIVFDNV